MATHCYIPILGKRLRVTSLDSCGNPPASGTAKAGLATDGFISVKLSSEVEDGTEIITKKASGALCVNEKLADSFKRFSIEMEFCGVNPALLAFMTNANPYNDYATDLAGFTIPEGTISKRFALELWTGLSGQACQPGVSEASGYLLLPQIVAGVLGDVTIDGENAVTFSLTGANTKGGNNWGVGPYKVVYGVASAPSPLPQAISPFDHLLLIDTAIAPPPSACDPFTMPGLVVTAVTPNTGSVSGSTNITITGNNFTGATGATVGGAAVTTFVVVNDTTITGKTAAHAAGAVDVVVTTPTGSYTKTGAFTYV